MRLGYVDVRNRTGAVRQPPGLHRHIHRGQRVELVGKGLECYLVSREGLEPSHKQILSLPPLPIGLPGRRPSVSSRDLRDRLLLRGADLELRTPDR